MNSSFLAVLGASFPPSEPLITDAPGLLAVLLTVLAIIFWLDGHPVIGRFFKIVPALVFCYFVPTALTTLGVIPDDAPLYGWIKTHVLPAALLLLILALDIPAIVKLGPKAGIMLLAGTIGVVIGGPISLWVCTAVLPESLALPDDIWQGMAALSGSWIGGGANFVAIGDVAEASNAMMASMVIPDVLVANIWTGVLFFFAARHEEIDRRAGANTQAIRDLEAHMEEFQKRTARIAQLPDYILILALGFGIAWISTQLGKALPDIGTLITSSTWKYILVTSIGVGLSFTKARNLEGAGASKVGAVMIYLLVACIGAGADFREAWEAKSLIIMGAVWISVHIIVLLTVAKLIRAPIFFVAVGSQANIGGAASAPVVAAAFHPALAPVGALLAVAGYVLGTYAGLMCMHLLKMVAHVN